MPATQFSTSDPYAYLNGFGSYHEYAAIVSSLCTSY